MITGFLILVMFYMAYRLNRDEEIILKLQDRVSNLENTVPEPLSEEIK